jgi:integrase
LDVRIEGSPPASGRLNDKGDAIFERSRVRAELRWEQIQEEIAGPQTQEDLLKRIHSIRSGQKGIPSVGLEEAIEKWAAVPRRRALSERTLTQARSRWDRFMAYVEANQPSARFLADITSETAERYMAEVARRGVAAKTYSNTLKGLSAVFNMLKKKASLHQNPFEEIPEKEPDSVGHAPFTPDELAAITDAARKPEHAFIRPVIVTGICTAMRRGDCATLKWSAVDLDGGFITVKTSKTNGTAVIPLFPLLADEIRRQLPKKGEYVFPACAMMYEANPDGVSYRVRNVLIDAGYSDADEAETEGHRGKLGAKRTTGIRRACLRGFHSFRVTWVTLALNAGVPMELVRRVTTHTTVDIVLEHYFKPGREDFRRVLTEKMPKMFSLGPPATSETERTVPAPAVLAELEAMTADNWLSVRDRLVSRLKQAV